jgi:hypothetical protein
MLSRIWPAIFSCRIFHVCVHRAYFGYNKKIRELGKTFGNNSCPREIMTEKMLWFSLLVLPQRGLKCEIFIFSLGQETVKESKLTS